MKNILTLGEEEINNIAKSFQSLNRPAEIVIQIPRDAKVVLDAKMFHTLDRNTEGKAEYIEMIMVDGITLLFKVKED